ncbi:MAG: aspartate kinase [Defluviitaleaceae bacterium]|nr:aspartate kinase [Defluviitaleaceae bacterium]
MLIVQKYGGSSVADAGKIMNVAKKITDAYGQGRKLVVVLSAQGDTTDELYAKAREISRDASRRELDALVTTGELQSAALMAIAVHKLGYPAISLNASQAGINATSAYGSARIKKIDPERIAGELERNNIVIVAGFQGINKYGDMTALGRGASDTTAVALAAVLNADCCEIYTDVDGVYTADPRVVKNARRIPSISFDEMLELASLGAQVLHNRAVEMAKRYRVKLVVRSSMTDGEGTLVCSGEGRDKTVEKTFVSGLAVDKSIARIALVGLIDRPGIAYQIFALLAKEKISVDIILQSIGREETKDISFTVAKNDLEKTLEALEAGRDKIGFGSISHDDNIAKLSVVGAGMASNPGVAAKMFEALYDCGVNISMISTSEIKISVLIDAKDADRAANAVHDKFMVEMEG